MKRHVILEKQVGETPLVCAENWREAQPPAYQEVPLAYAGRLDPMASGKLLVLIGDECKKQSEYHGLDKEYVVDILFGVRSDTGDVLGLIESEAHAPQVGEADLRRMLTTLSGPINLPYPKFSSKTVKGKPLHTWTLENRLDEIKIPKQTASIHTLTLNAIQTKTASTIAHEVLQKIDTIPPVTDASKAIGNDFRRTDIRPLWKAFAERHKDEQFTIATITCVASSGAYMRSLAEEIGCKLGHHALAYHIHRSKIGKYQPLPFGFGFWLKQF